MGAAAKSLTTKFHFRILLQCSSSWKSPPHSIIRLRFRDGPSDILSVVVVNQQVCCTADDWTTVLVLCIAEMSCVGLKPVKTCNHQQVEAA